MVFSALDLQCIEIGMKRGEHTRIQPLHSRQLICLFFTFICPTEGRIGHACYASVICRVVSYIPLPRIRKVHYGHSAVRIMSALMS